MDLFTRFASTYHYEWLLQTPNWHKLKLSTADARSQFWQSVCLFDCYVTIPRERWQRKRLIFFLCLQQSFRSNPKISVATSWSGTWLREDTFAWTSVGGSWAEGSWARWAFPCVFLQLREVQTNFQVGFAEILQNSMIRTSEFALFRTGPGFMGLRPDSLFTFVNVVLAWCFHTTTILNCFMACLKFALFQLASSFGVIPTFGKNIQFSKSIK